MSASAMGATVQFDLGRWLDGQPESGSFLEIDLSRLDDCANASPLLLCAADVRSLIAHLEAALKAHAIALSTLKAELE